ncbi:MAG: hypothetical protein ACT6FE_07590 [Methanosarcinaceae archaeon]
MRKVEIQPQNHLEIEGIEGFIVRKATKFGNSAKVVNGGVKILETLFVLMVNLS